MCAFLLEATAVRAICSARGSDQKGRVASPQHISGQFYAWPLIKHTSRPDVIYYIDCRVVLKKVLQIPRIDSALLQIEKLNYVHTYVTYHYHISQPVQQLKNVKSFFKGPTLSFMIWQGARHSWQ